MAAESATHSPSPLCDPEFQLYLAMKTVFTGDNEGRSSSSTLSSRVVKNPIKISQDTSDKKINSQMNTS